jgi:hypothetical protein
MGSIRGVIFGLYQYMEEYLPPCFVCWKPIAIIRYGNSCGAVLGLHITIQFCTRVFPTARRLARIHAMLERFLHHCLACGGDVPKFIEHILLECP